MDVVDDLLYVLTLCEGYVVLVCAFMVVLVAPYGHHHHRLTTHLGMFAIAALALLLTAALADRRRSRRHSRG
jgi:hypothetical protein